MPTDKPRIQVMLDDELHGVLASMAKRQNESISSIAASLVKEALELHEDKKLSAHGDQRLRQTKKWVPHAKVWKD